MSPWVDQLLAQYPLRAEVVFAGTLCDGDRPLHPWPGGSLHFVRSGRGELLRPAQPPLALEAPAVIYLPGGGAHGLRAEPGGCIDVVCALLACDDGFERTLVHTLPPVVALSLVAHPPLHHTLEAFFAEAIAPGARGCYLERQLCAAVLVQLLRAGVPTRPQAHAVSDSRIAAAVQALERHCGDPGLDVAALAAVAGMSRSRFAAQFRVETGCSPHRYLQRHRIALAQRMLAKGLAVKVVADRVGFRTASAFCACFRQLTGTPPAAWSRGTFATHNETIATPPDGLARHSGGIFHTPLPQGEQTP